MRLVRVFSLGLILALGVSTSAFAQKYVCMQSTQGEWCMELLREAAPNTVTNFLQYVNSGVYNNILVQRSVPGFVIQAGGYEIDANNQLAAVPSFGTVNNEFNRSNLRGTVAMAKLGGDPNSASNQWFINLGNNASNLDSQNGGFTVFAEVVYGMAAVDKIAALRVLDISNIFGSDFTNAPLDISATATQLERKNLVIITRAYATDFLPGTTAAPFHCTAAVTNDALTELCDGLLNFPVQIDGGKYDVTLELIPGQAQLVFGVKAGSLKALAIPSASIASYVDATGEVLIPSVRVGAVIYDNVVLKLTNRSALQFTVQSYKQR